MMKTKFTREPGLLARWRLTDCSRSGGHTHTYVHSYIHAHIQTKCKASLIAQLVKNLPAVQETPVQFLAQEDPLEKG